MSASSEAERREQTAKTVEAIAAAYRGQLGLDEQRFAMGLESDFFWHVIKAVVDADHDDILYWTFLDRDEKDDDWLLVLLDD